MHLYGCGECGNKRLAGLGWVQWAVAAYDMYNKSQNKGGGGGQEQGGGGMPSNMNVNTVSTTTTVSPQISPQFIQQQSPVNSPVAAGINPPNVGMAPYTGYLPGFDWLPNLQQQAGGMNPLALAAGVGIAAFAIAAIVRKKRKGRR